MTQIIKGTYVKIDEPGKDPDEIYEKDERKLHNQTPSSGIGDSGSQENIAGTGLTQVKSIIGIITGHFSYVHNVQVTFEPQKRNDALENMVDCYRNILRHVGEDINRGGVMKTPQRAANAMLYLTKGYDETLDGKKLILCQLQILMKHL